MNKNLWKFDILSFDLIQYISEFTDIITLLRIVILNKKTAAKIKIKYINDHFKILNDDILQQVRYHDLIKLNISYNPYVSIINHLTKLQELYIAGQFCNVSNEQLQTLYNLVTLDITSNSKIKNIGHLTKLRKLYISGICGVDDTQLQSLYNLVILDANCNPYIKNIGHLTKLQELYISGNCGVDDKQIQYINPIVLNANNNPNIKKINHM